GLSQGVEAIPASGQELVRVGLVPGVPHDPVARRVHHPMQGERDLDRAQRARQVAAGVLDGADHLFAQLRLALLESRIAERAPLPRQRSSTTSAMTCASWSATSVRRSSTWIHATTAPASSATIAAASPSPSTCGIRSASCASLDG